MAAKEKKKQCFVVGPIGGDDSDDRVHADWLLEAIIQPVFEEHFPDFEVTRADKLSKPGQITTQVITALLDAELVIADLTTLNPNAFYEIGIRHTIQKPIIHMHLEGQSIPFDIAAFRSLKFARRKPSDIKLASATLVEFVRDALSEDHEIDNPVTFSRGKVEFEKTATPSERIMQEQMQDVLERLSAIEHVATRSNRMQKYPHLTTWLSQDGTSKLIKLTIIDHKRKRNTKLMMDEVNRVASRYFTSVALSPSLGINPSVDIEIGGENSDSNSLVSFVKDLQEVGYEVSIIS